MTPPKLATDIPYPFVLEELASVTRGKMINTRKMFGCTSIYVEDKIVLIMRNKDTERQDNGVWIATTSEHHSSLAKDFPSMRSISLFGPGPTGWQILPEDSSDFEDSVMKVCRLIARDDPRIGKIPKRKKVKKSLKKSSRK